jgi:hypothetical protein
VDESRVAYDAAGTLSFLALLVQKYKLTLLLLLLLLLRRRRRQRRRARRRATVAVASVFVLLYQ